MEIREVYIDQVDVDENNPRQDMGDLAALAETFDAGPYPGEPINPIVVAVDGDRYRVIDALESDGMRLGEPGDRVRETAEAIDAAVAARESGAER